MAVQHPPKQMSDTFLLGALLAVVGGFLDAHTYLAREHVFANAQTGNMVLFGLNLAEGNLRKAAAYLLPILAFVLGVLLTEAIRSRFRASRPIHWRQIVILIELLALAAVAFLPAPGANIFANTLVSFICSVQVQSFRKVGGNPFATTMCTGNLRSACEQFCRFRQTRDPAALHSSLQYCGIILFFIAGAVLGAVLTHWYAQRAALFSCALLAAVFALMFLRREVL
ncbi:YoaK family protein [Ligaoa zhengdingensis]|nr:YoaK family protein [Ligaoa zhengdingensis]